jgi:uncharacterized protein (DUF2147 family)
MSKSFSTAIAMIGLLISGAAQAQSAPNVDGIWRTQDGSTTVQVTKCPTNPNWCATVTAERLEPGEPSQLNQMLVRDMRPKGKLGWTGQYVADGQNMKASAKLLASDTLAFKICALAFLCETVRLRRIQR